MAKAKARTDELQNMEVITSELAGLVGKTPQWIRQLTREGVLKQVGRGKYRLADGLQAYIEYVAGGKEGDDKPRLVEHRTEHERIKAERAALELEELRGNLHTTADIEEAWGDLLVEFRKRLMGMPPKLAVELAYMTDAKEIRRLLFDELAATLQILAQYDPGKRDPDESAEETDT